MTHHVYSTLSVIIVGFILGVLFSKQLRSTNARRLARSYYAMVAVLVVVNLAANTFGILEGPHAASTNSVTVASIISLFLFGAIFGLAVRRERPVDLLGDDCILKAIVMLVAFAFALAGVGKAFSMSSMSEFFTQSGYSPSFLKFIIIAEVFGAVGLMVRWAFLPALVGLTIDMFGAVVTHVHNGDPLDDSTGAINMLVRLLAIGLLWTLHGSFSSSLSNPNLSNTEVQWTSKNGKRIFAVCIAAVACLLVAIGGGVALRH